MAHKIAAGELYDKKTFGTFPKKFDLMTLLPEQFRIRSKVPTTINVAPIPEELQEKIGLAQDKTGTAAELDLAELLSHESSSDSLIEAPEGLATTITEAIRELATNISNLWN
ncbi:hypothetical protein BGX34_007922, partial [Mortierella sp. NVP85]